MPPQRERILVVRTDLKPHHEDLIRAAGAAHRDTKHLREQSRRTDRTLAQLEEAIYGFFGIEYKNVTGQQKKTEVKP